MLDSGELSSFRSVEYPMVSHETTFRNGSNDDMTVILSKSCLLFDDKVPEIHCLSTESDTGPGEPLVLHYQYYIKWYDYRYWYFCQYLSPFCIFVCFLCSMHTQSRVSKTINYSPLRSLLMM